MVVVVVVLSVVDAELTMTTRRTVMTIQIVVGGVVGVAAAVRVGG